MKECEFPGCTSSFYTQGDEAKKYCKKHDSKAKRVVQQGRTGPPRDPAPKKAPVSKPDPRPAPPDYRPPIEAPTLANPLLEAFDVFQEECRKIFIARQNQHGKESILDVTLEDLVGVHRLKGARIKQQIKTGVPFPEVLHDSLIDDSVYCFILWAVHSGEWEQLEWGDAA